MQKQTRFFHLAITDLKLIARDKSLLLFLFIPVIILPVLRWGLPEITRLYPALTNYYSLVIGFMAVIISVFPGFIMAFIVIDEKEQNVLQVLRVLPFSFRKFVYIRILLTSVMGFVYSLLILKFSGLVTFTGATAIQAAILCAFPGPVSALLILSIVSNKIEGMTYMKGLNFLWVIPVAHFFVDGNWKYAFAFIPDYWTLQIVFNGEDKGYFFAGLMHHLLVLLLAEKWFSRKTLQK